MAKRKAKSQLGNPSKKTATSRTHKRDTQTPFRFLDLPAELRTQILALFAHDTGTALLKRTSRGQVVTADAVGRVNKQLREEYIGVLYEHARTTLAHVRDFDFRHVVTYFNRLNKAEVEALPVKSATPEQAPTHKKIRFIPTWNFSATPASTSKPESATPIIERRSLKIFLDFTPTASWQDGFLTRWLNRQQATHKIGSNTQIDYEVLSKEATWEWKGRWNWLQMMQSWPWPAEQQAEVDKMIRVVKEAVREEEARMRRSVLRG